MTKCNTIKGIRAFSAGLENSGKGFFARSGRGHGRLGKSGLNNRAARRAEQAKIRKASK